MLKLEDKYRVMFENRNYRLEKQEEVKEKKSGEIKQVWKFVGFYGTMNSALRRYIDEKIRDLEEVTEPELIKVLKDLKRHIDIVVKRENIILEKAKDE
ncbi:hypothetical protein [Lederbergia lenta]|uniref:hypothetical protein n=1 Tax=Lederbergia lenta TaxID=1467 RepID=UPI00203AFE9E|nr:hypothetical protein [Lederbergia lenta]MCM3109871.1 hypothetical protein [Lederbergia lenta]